MKELSRQYKRINIRGRNANTSTRKSIRSYRQMAVESNDEAVMEIRDDGARIWKNRQGKIHRRDGPAIEFIDGTKKWYLNGILHREDGPALEWADGSRQWYLNGKQHREDGPSSEWADGSREWWMNGKLHREDGPAMELANGNRSWYIRGKRHRIEGPAVEDTITGREWWIKGYQFPNDESQKMFVNELRNLVWQLCTSKLVADPMFAEYFLEFLL